MSESAKKALLIVIVILASAAAAYSIFKFSTGDKPVDSGVHNDLPPGAKTGKQREVEAMQRGAGGEEKDASSGGSTAR